MMKIFFPRYQRRFLKMGDVGGHPQFRHLERPPAGFEFVATPMGWGAWFRAWPSAFWRALQGWKDLFKVGRAAGVSWLRIVGFLWSRGTGLVAAPRGQEITFLPTFPFTHQNEKWFLEIEDVTTLFRPYILNGRTESVRVRDLEAFPLVKRLLESPQCLGILTHVSSTRDSVQKIFGPGEISAKTRFLPATYLPPVEVSETELNALRNTRTKQFFFNNSWHQDPTNFYLRGGISILEAFEKAYAQDLPIKLVIRSRLPKHLDQRFNRVLRDPRTSLLDRFLPQESYLRTLRSSHYFLLPSARLHVVSLLEAMYYGAVPVVSDGWGISDYTSAGHDALAVPGIYGRVSWVDEKSGELRENYRPMYEQPGILTDELYQMLQEACNADQHAELSLNAHRRVREVHSVERFNPEFSKFLNAGLATL